MIFRKYISSLEYYHEVPNYDSRIAIRKFLDARDTIGFAKFSLSYIGTDPCNNRDKNFARIIHLRHAIEDLNNSFDLLLQIPWFYYRAWEAFNKGGVLSQSDKTLTNVRALKKTTFFW